MEISSTRRHFLQAAGAGLALPLLGRAAEKTPPNRLLAIHVPLGMMPSFFFPKAGENSSPYLEKIAEHRDYYTVFSGLSHPDINANHHAGQCFLTGAPGPGQPTFRNSISMDQIAAEEIGAETRFPYLCLSVSAVERYVDSVSVSRSGVNIPALNSPNRLYRNLFVAGTPAEKAATMRRIEAGGSVLDLVLGQGKAPAKFFQPRGQSSIGTVFR